MYIFSILFKHLDGFFLWGLLKFLIHEMDLNFATHQFDLWFVPKHWMDVAFTATVVAVCAHSHFQSNGPFFTTAFCA